MTEPVASDASQKIRPRDRDAILQSLRAGVVPRRGHQHIQVGRAEEVRALLNDLEGIRDGGSALRFIIGEYGSGKTFFLSLVRSIALEKGLVAAHADLNPDRRLHATGGQARSLYTELMANLATRTRPDGGAVASVVERFVTSALQEAREQGAAPAAVLQNRLGSLSEMTGGYDFAEVIAAYWRGHDEANDQLKSDAVRWLRGEFSTKTDARKALGVRTIIDDDNLYDQLKLFSRFVRLAGYGGFLVCLDELVNLYKLSNTQARNSNYEQLLRILNDSLQGASVGLGFLLGGTPEFLMDTRRGLYSYEALRSRLAQNRFLAEGLKDYTGPVLHLANLSQEELYILLRNLRNVQAGGEPERYLLPDEGLVAFMEHCSKRLGEAYFRTPRTTIRAFLELLAILEQNPQASWRDLLGAVDVKPDVNPDLEPVAPTSDDDELASFKL
ncbi:MAG TPA: ATP-binding protein [Thermoanaerobaculia bacterium]|nr:ATP-binding protein [Thermoanaerobaculia bacterium]